MISEYIELIESFKENQFSALIATIHTKVLETLKSKHFNPRLAPYLEKMNKEGVPFTNFELDPENVSQIKKLINALYYARLAFLDLEKLDIRNLAKSYDNLKLVYGHTIHQAYQASYLITHLDVDIQDIFKDELALFLPAFTKLKAFASTYSKDTKEIVDSLKTYPIAYTVGEVSGIVLDQMQPDPNDWNYEVLTKFSALLPGYIQEFTSIIEKYSTQIKEKEPTLNNAKLEEIQTAALKLLNDIENLRGNGLFVSLKVLNYIHIIRNIITLSTSALEQMGHFSKSSQDLIRDRLAQLKYVHLPTLFGLVDKIEVNAMLQPGTFSIPLMKQIKPLYAWLIHYASKPVNFQEKGEELLSIEDSRFLELRLENTYKRIDVAYKALFKIQKVQAAFDEFFNLLSDARYSKLAIHDLPNGIKEQLISHYKLLSPYMQEVDVDFNELLVKTFLNGESTRSYLGRPYRWLRGQKPDDHVSFVLAKRSTLQDLITKKRETQLFHIQLNEDLLHSVHRQTELTLFPYNATTNVFTIDEATALSKEDITQSQLKFKLENGSNVLANPEDLTSNQALELHQWYKNKHNKFVVAREAYFEFITLIKPFSAPIGDTKVTTLNLSRMNEGTREKCKRLYNAFQPYFINGVHPDLKNDVLSFDKQFVRALNNDQEALKAPVINLFEQLDKHFQVYFTNIDLSWARSNNKYLRIADDKFKKENDAAILKLEVNTENRAHFVIKHTRYSKMVHDLRKELTRASLLFNHTMRAELRLPDLNPQGALSLSDIQLPELPKGIPYPELMDKDKDLSQASQVVAFKRIWNSLYHIEKIISELEKLNNKSTETRYVYHLLQAYDHINEIKHLVIKLSQDPHFKLIGSDIIERIQWIIATAQEQTYSYQVAPTEIEYQGLEVENNALWYTLNAFYILPKHIRSLRNDNYLTTDELENLHVRAKKANITIENIIKSSDSYFKLFLQSPAMFSLYQEMNKKLHEFLSTAHDTMMNNLDQFHEKIFTPMLLEADAWENRLCLKPGLISGPLKKITDEYYKGLLHPLRLPSKVHIQMICDMTPIHTRIKKAQKQMELATRHSKDLDNSYKHIIKLHELLRKYKANFDAKSSIVPTILERVTEQEIIEEYKKAMYKLHGLQSKLPQAKGDPIYNKELDQLLNANLEEYDPQLCNIHDLVNSSYHHYLGLKNTYAMKFATAKEKQEYLEQLQKTQEQENIQFVEDYTVEVFNDQLEIICNQHIGLQYTYKEFNTNLRTYLLTFKNEIVQNSKTAENINVTVKKLLHEKTKLFKNMHFAQFERLDKIEGVLGQFRTYFDKSQKAIDNGGDVFESNETLETKTKRINALETICKDTTLTVKQRIDKIADHVVKDPSFERVMLHTDSKEAFSFAQIKQLFFKLLELLFYTPERKALLNNLKESVKPPTTETPSYFGFFSSTKAKRSKPEEAKPEQDKMTSQTVLVH
ncbi:hypothetical protein [Legionella waltersii]|uniref:SdhA, substrate of the Dot/Icm system n=1 Tax=Legionella waltersii TaxID=66969 RepID=A0A0W1A289_9GAMM|nr:hypothetical protein [Legionella waltersii]KTD75493.1 SdhA, substrate of the Dot/Icm system [Legionella waltersii]SNU98310.1 SdhA, GRIP coiled-coil protein GCC185 [Legionella waltersii]